MLQVNHIRHPFEVVASPSPIVPYPVLVVHDARMLPRITTCAMEPNGIKRPWAVCTPPKLMVFCNQLFVVFIGSILV